MLAAAKAASAACSSFMAWMGVLVDKSGEAVAVVQNRCQFHNAEEIGGENLTISRAIPNSPPITRG